MTTRPDRAPEQAARAPCSVFALVGTVVVTALVALSTAHHEVWRDEVGAWLMARDTASPFAIFHAIRYEGHPSLWFLVLWPITRLTRSLVGMQVANVAIVGAAVYLVLRHAPGPRWIRSLAVLGYFVVYEYGTIARNYGLSVLLLVGAMCVLPRRRERPLLFGLLLAGAAHTSLPALILAAALAVAVALESWMLGERGVRSWSWAAVAAAGFVLAVWQLVPPPDTGYAMGWSFDLAPEHVANTLTAVTRAYLPLPIPGPGFWQSQLLASWSPGYAIASWAIALLLLALAIASLRDRTALVFFVVATAGLLAFFHVKFFGYLRHHGFLWVALALAAWLSALHRRRAVVPVAALVAVLCVHVAGGAIAIAGDWRYRFSAAGAMAATIRELGLDRLPLTGGEDLTLMPIVGLLDKRGAYYPEGRRFGASIVFDRARLDDVMPLWEMASTIANASGDAVVVVMDAPTLDRVGVPRPLAEHIQVVKCEESEVVFEESYCMAILRPDPRVAHP